MAAESLSGPRAFDEFMKIYHLLELAGQEFDQRGDSARAEIYAKYALKIQTLCDHFGIESDKYMADLAVKLYPGLKR